MSCNRRFPTAEPESRIEPMTYSMTSVESGDHLVVRKLHRKHNTGAREQNRTADLLITNELLYQLSYPGGPQTVSADGPVPDGL